MQVKGGAVMSSNVAYASVAWAALGCTPEWDADFPRGVPQA